MHKTRHKYPYLCLLLCLLLCSGCTKAAKPKTGSDAEEKPDSGKYWYACEETVLEAPEIGTLSPYEKTGVYDYVAFEDTVYRPFFYAGRRSENLISYEVRLQILQEDHTWREERSLYAETENNLNGEDMKNFWIFDTVKIRDLKGNFWYLSEENPDTKERTFSCFRDGEIINQTLTISADIMKTYVNCNDAAYFVCDYDGNYYLFEKNSANLFVLGCDLENLSVKKLPGEISGMIQNKEQAPLYWYGADKDGDFCICEVGKDTPALKLQDVDVRSVVCALDADGALYIADGNGVFMLPAGWTDGQNLQRLYDFRDSYPLDDILGMKIMADGSIHLTVMTDGVLERLHITKKEGEAPKKEEIVILTWARYEALSRAAKRFNRQSDTYRITVVSGFQESGYDTGAYTENFNAMTKQLSLDLSSGKGPDLVEGIFFSDATAEWIQNGYFAPIEGFLTDQEEYVAGALDAGCYDGRLYGIPFETSYFTVGYAAGDLDGADALTIDAMMEALRRSGNYLLRTDDPAEVVYDYAIRDVANKTYIDWESGVSHLEDDAFITFLAFVKDHTVSGSVGNGADAEELFDKGAFAKECYLPDMDGLMWDMLSFPKEFQFLGYPSASGYGIYCDVRCLYCNASSEKKEGIAEFARFLLSSEEQKKYAAFYADPLLEGHVGGPAFPIRKDAWEVYFATRFEKRGQADFFRNEEDLGAWKEKMKEQMLLLQNEAKPYPKQTLGIKSMLYEELTPYFRGEISAKEAAGKLHARVQLYLDERK